MKILKSYRNKNNKLTKKSRRLNNKYRLIFKNGGGKKEDLIKQIVAITNEIYHRDLGLFQESFSRHIPEPNKEFDPMYIHKKTLTDEYNELNFPMKDLQDALDLQIRQRREEEERQEQLRKAKKEEERLKMIEWNKRRDQIEMKEAADMRARLDAAYLNYYDRITNFITKNSKNIDLLESELQKLEADRDETTRDGQPPNAAFLSKTYEIAENILTAAIENYKVSLTDSAGQATTEPNLFGIGCKIESADDRIEIVSVKPSGSASGKLKPGDVLISVNGIPVDSETQAKNLILGLRHTGISLKVMRQGKFFVFNIFRNFQLATQH